MTKEDAKVQITGLWLEWLATRERTSLSQDMQMFYGHLQKQHSQALSFRSAGDKWQTVKSWIQDRY